MNRASRRHGFTLVEVLVILAILAALAAILVPTVSNQVRKADVGRVTGDLTNLRTGVEAFLVDVHRYPLRPSQLANPITTTDTDINGAGNTYPSGLVARWEGPYIDQLIATGDSLETGFGGFVRDTFTITTEPNGIEYLTVTIIDLAQPEFETIDAEIDGTVDATGGLLRFTAGPPAEITYLALPIN